MLTIIHGDDTSSSRNFLHEQKKGRRFSSFDAGSVTLTDLVQELDGRGLFQETQTVFVEHLFSKKKDTELKSILSYLQKQIADIFIWEGKELSRSILSGLKGTKLELFKHPSTLFQFLDSLSPQKSQQTLSLFHETLVPTTPDMIFAMLTRQIRLLQAVRHGAEIEEVKRLAPWQLGKLQKQAQMFASEKLSFLHMRLFTIDKAQKTGVATVPLSSAIDFFLLEL